MNFFAQSGMCIHEDERISIQLFVQEHLESHTASLHEPIKSCKQVDSTKEDLHLLSSYISHCKSGKAMLTAK